MRSVGVWKLLTLVALVAGPAPALAQESQPATPEAATREAAIEQAQAEKDAQLEPYVLSKGERIANKAEDIILHGLPWYPFFENAYQGGGFTFGVGHRRYVSPYNQIDVRGSYTLSGYKRAEAEFVAPHLFNRRGALSLVGGWREATEVGFYGIGPDSLEENRTSYDFRQPYAQATLTLHPTRGHWLLQGGTEWTEWQQRAGHGSFPSVDTRFTPQTLPGLNADVTYIHSQATMGFDWRPFPGYARRGGYYGVTVHDYTDTGSDFGFNTINYEAIQHVPILRETWAVTLRGVVQTAFSKGDQEIPFFMLPSLGGGSTLRGFQSWRFRDRNSLLLQAEWRVMANRFFDTALFYDTGKVASRTSDLDLNGLKHDYGVGFRFHSLDSTILRVDVARSGEGTRFVFAASHGF
jgi:hypothetical protein